MELFTLTQSQIAALELLFTLGIGAIIVGVIILTVCDKADKGWNEW